MLNFKSRLYRLRSVFALANGLAALVVLFPTPGAFAVKQTDPIDYSDPNMAMTQSYVTEASSACIRKSGSTGGPVTDCIRSYKAEPNFNDVKVAEKKKPAIE